MVVTKTTYARYLTYEGTLAEVMTAVNGQGNPHSKIISVFYDASTSKVVAVVGL